MEMAVTGGGSWLRGRITEVSARHICGEMFTIAGWQGSCLTLVESITVRQLID
jgi:hypothetical protein